MEDSRLCNMCPRPAPRICTGCRNSRYCSPECQRADWPIHKLVCKTFNDFATRPDENVRRAIYFPDKDSKPYFIWLPFESIELREDEGPQSPVLGTLLGPDKPNPKAMPVSYNLVLDRILSHQIRFVFRDGFSNDGSVQNMSIASTMDMELLVNFCGPIIAYGLQNEEGEKSADNLHGFDGPRLSDDLDTIDFRHARDHLRCYQTKRPVNGERFYGKRVTGVRINCAGDMGVFKRPMFESVELPETHAIFSQAGKPSIPNRIELPLLVDRLPHHPAWMNGAYRGMADYDNQLITFLHLECDPNAKYNPSQGSLGWGWAPVEYQQKVGSIMVVRQDGKPLLPGHMEAICDFCMTRLQPIFESAANQRETPEVKQSVLDQITKAKFIDHFKRWHKFEGRRYKDLVSPYDM